MGFFPLPDDNMNVGQFFGEGVGKTFIKSFMFSDFCQNLSKLFQTVFVAIQDRFGSGSYKSCKLTEVTHSLQTEIIGFNAKFFPRLMQQLSQRFALLQGAFNPFEPLGYEIEDSFR